jgi:hypothetical protein
MGEKPEAPPSEGGGGDPHPALTYDQAQREMLKEMTLEERISHFQDGIATQQARVEEWRNQSSTLPSRKL